MCIFRINPGCVKMTDFFPVKQDIHRIPCCMTAFDNNRPASHCMDCFCSFFHVRKRFDSASCYFFRFRNIWCQYISKRDNRPDQRFDCRRLHEWAAVLCIHHRINYYICRVVIFQFCGNFIHTVRCGKHTDFHCINLNIFKNRIHLFTDHIRADILNADYPVCVFCYNRYNDAHSKYAMCGKCF